MGKEKVSMSKLWKQSGKKQTFTDFANQFNANNNGNFKIFIAHPLGQQNPPSDDQQPDYVKNPPILPVPPDQAPVVQEEDFDRKQGLLIVVLGITIGVVSVLVYNHATK